VPARRILVVDDYAPAAQALTRLLRLNGHTVMSAATVAEARTITLDFRPEIVLLDLNLEAPGDGLIVARWIRAEAGLDGVVLVALTGQCDSQIERRLSAAGIGHYLVKPIPFAELESIILAADFR